jgi:hypothetical protein
MSSSETGTAGVSSLAARGIVAWLTPVRFAGLLALLICATFPEVIFGQASFFHRDFGAFTYPIARYYRECFWRGELPLWNPLNDCGIPLLAQWNTAILYPPSLFYLLLPLPWSLGVFGLAHLLFAGLGMHLLARRWTGSDFAAAVAGIGFAFNGLTWHMLVWISNLAAWAWMPWVVLAVEAAWRRPRARETALAALAGAMQMLTGAPEMILLTWLFLLALVAVNPISKWPALAARLAFIGVVVAGLSAAQLLPFLDLLRHSNRDAGFSDSGWALPVSGLGDFLVPLFRCFPSGQGVFVQYEQYWTPSTYAGIGVVGLAMVALWRVRERRVWLLAGAAAISLLMALGAKGGLYPLVRATLPQLGFMRYPVKFITLAMFALPLLAGFGVRWLEAASPVSARQSLLSVGILLAALIVVIVLRAWSHPSGWDDWHFAWSNGIIRAEALTLILITCLATVGPPSRWRIPACLALLVLLWVDVFTHAPKINPTVSPQVFEQGRIRAELKPGTRPLGGEARAMRTRSAIEATRRIQLPDPVEDYLCRRVALFDDCNLLDEIPKTDGFFSIYLREYDQINWFLVDADAKGAGAEGLKDFMGVGLINAGTGLNWTNRPTVMPLITGGQRPVFASAPDTVSNLLRPDFNPRETIYLPPQASRFVTATNSVDAKISPGQLEAEELDFTVDASGPAIVSVAQAYYHDWRAYVDGQPTTVWPANHAFQAIEVPRGRHNVRLVYRDDWFFAGAWISTFCLGICGLMLLKRSAVAALPA